MTGYGSGLFCPDPGPANKIRIRSVPPKLECSWKAIHQPFMPNLSEATAILLVYIIVILHHPSYPD